MLIAGLPALADAGAREIDVLAFAIGGARQQQKHEMHGCRAAIARELAHCRILALLRREPHPELADDVAEPMKLLLARDMALGAAGELNVLLAIEHVPDAAGLLGARLPHV